MEPNALQIRALPIIRQTTGPEGRQAAVDADELFARAYEIFPNQPLLLRNWAQLRFNDGDNWGAYRLLDRMEIIPLSGYTEGEKVAIAKGYLVPRQLRENGLRPNRAIHAHRESNANSLSTLAEYWA